MAASQGPIDWAAAKRIVVSTEAGAQLVLEGGNVTVQCPGTITVHASATRFEAPLRQEAVLPALPRQVCESCLLAARAANVPFALQ